jgi:hypothetical protein
MDHDIHPRRSKDKRSVEYDREDFEKALPNLASELDRHSRRPKPQTMSAIIDQAELEPSTVGYLRRCTNKNQAIEIINFQLKRNEITLEEAKEFRNTLESKGLEAFGPQKSWGHYERHFRKADEFEDIDDDEIAESIPDETPVENCEMKQNQLKPEKLTQALKEKHKNKVNNDEDAEEADADQEKDEDLEDEDSEEDEVYDDENIGY